MNDMKMKFNAEFQEKIKKKPRKLKENISSTIQLIEGQDLIKKKQEILNKSLLESISEIISNHEDFYKLSNLNINYIEINRELLHVKIFWNFTGIDVSKTEEYSQILNDMDIQKNLKFNYYRNSPPDITFYYDVYDGVNSRMEHLFNEVGKETIKLKQEPFDPSKLFEKEKLIKKEFDIKSLILRDPSIDFPRDEKSPTKFKCPYDMNLFMCNLDFRRIYEYLLVQLSQGKSKRTLVNLDDVKIPSLYVSAPLFKESNVYPNHNEDMTLTDERIKLMKKFVISNKKKVQRQSRELKKEMFDRLDDDLEKNLEIKKNIQDRYDQEDW